MKYYFLHYEIKSNLGEEKRSSVSPDHPMLIEKDFNKDISSEDKTNGLYLFKVMLLISWQEITKEEFDMWDKDYI